MLSKKLMSALIILCSFIAFSTSAVVAAPFLPGEIQHLEDEDYETLLRYNDVTKIYEEIAIDNTTRILEGDLFMGVIKIQQTENVDGTNNHDLQSEADTFTGLFLTECATSNGDGSINNSFDTLTFTSVDAATWDDVLTTYGVTELDALDLDGSGTDIHAGTTMLMFDGVAFNSTVLTPDLGTSIDSFIDGNLLYEFGFTGASDEFWTANGIDAEFPWMAVTSNVITRLSLNVTQQWAGPELLPMDYLGLGALAYGNVPDMNYTGEAQLQAKGFFESSNSGEWGLSTDTDLYFNAVPEPTTMILFGLGLLGIAGIGRKRS